jgi:hypothetical protein
MGAKTMNKRVLAAGAIVSLIGFLVSACGTPAPEGPKTRYASAAWGLSIWYPDDWTYEESESGVTFFSSEHRNAQGEMEKGPLMSIRVGSDWDPRNSDQLCGWLVFAFFDCIDCETEIGDPQLRQIGKEAGCEIPFEDRSLDVRGFLAGTVHEGWLYIFSGISPLVEWPEHGPDLEAMLDSVGFTIRASPTPSATAAVTPVAASSPRPTSPVITGNLVQRTAAATSPDNADQVTESAARARGRGFSASFPLDGEILASVCTAGRAWPWHSPGERSLRNTKGISAE